jgi:GxxExxY protein
VEAVYQEALEVECRARAIPYEREVRMPISYKGVVLNTIYKADFVCYGGVIVELKALKQLTGLEEAQVINYMKASGKNKSLLINFGAQRLEYKRMVYGGLFAEDADSR